MNDPFTLRLADGCATICMNGIALGKPPVFDHERLDAFSKVLGEIEGRAEEARVLILQSSSEKFFHAGADVKALERLNPQTIEDWVRHGHAVLNQLEDLPIPVVARVQGFALGGGLELALACDLILAGPSARFGQTEARLGFVPGWGGSLRLTRRIGLARAKELTFTAKIIDAVSAWGLGLVDFSGDDAELDGWVDSFLEAVQQSDRHALAASKQLLKVNAEDPERKKVVSRETAASRHCVDHPSTRKRIETFLHRRKT